MKSLLSILLLLSLNISEASEKITFHDGGNADTYIVELLSSKDIGEQKGLEFISSASKKKCANKPAHFGKYRFQGEETVSSKDGTEKASFRMIQQLFCGEIPSSSQKQTKLLSDEDKNKLENKARYNTELYLDSLAKSDFKKAYSLLSTTLQQDKSFKEWFSSKKGLRDEPGMLKRSEVWGVTTYVDPPSSPRKGIYIATDFEREYTQFPIFCGYLAWYLEGDKLKLIREDIGHIDSKQLGNMSAEDISMIKSKFRCKPLTS